MINKIFSSLKIVTLAVVLSFSISYVYAWVAPTSAPTGGNKLEPINVSATAQTKSGGLTVGSLTSAGLVSAGAWTLHPGGDTWLRLMTSSGSAYKDIAIGNFYAAGNQHNVGNQYNVGNINANDYYIRASGKWASQLGGGVGVSVYLCPLVADSTYGRYRVWPGSPSACAGQLTTHTTCVTLTPDKTWNCTFAGRLTP